MGFEAQGSGLQLPVQLFNPLFQLRARYLQRQVAKPQIEELPVCKAIQPKSHEKYCRIFRCDIS